jgi:ABC-type multidrug transport system ATPase subunit
MVGAPLIVVAVVMVVVALRFMRVRMERTRRDKATSSSSPSSSPSSASAPAAAATQGARARIDVGFGGLSLRAGQLSILEELTGSFPSGVVTAVMGPSGAGKSSLINAVFGKVTPSSGQVTFNGSPIEGVGRGALRKLVGYCPQDDVLAPDLTVQETLEHSAALRLRGSSPAERSEAVERTLELLNLTHVRYSLVGGTTRRGVSGGERRRVSIAVEVISRPTILVLDEPTTGLDSTGAESLIRLLKKIASTGVTVIAIIHQPSASTFALLDRLVLLAKGGKMVYQGPIKDVIPAIEAGSGAKMPPRVNPADWMMDALSGAVPEIDPEVLPAYWARNTNANTNLAPSATGGIPAEDLAGRGVASFPAQVRAYCARSLKQVWANLDTLLFFCCLHIFVALCVSIGFVGGILYLPPLPSEYLAFTPQAVQIEFAVLPAVNEVQRWAVYNVMALGLTVVTIATNSLAGDRRVYLRESSWGISTLAYVIGRCVAELPIIILGTTLYFLTLVFVVAPDINLAKFYAALLVVNFAIFGVGHCTAAIFSPKQAALAGVVFALLGGLQTTANGGSYFSWGRWFTEAVYVLGMDLARFKVHPSTYQAVSYFQTKYMFGFAMKPNVYAECIGFLWLFWFVLHALTVIIMSLRWKKEKS